MKLLSDPQGQQVIQMHKHHSKLTATNLTIVLYTMQM